MRHDGTVSQILYYKLVAHSQSGNILVYLTENGQVADEDMIDD